MKKLIYLVLVLSLFFYCGPKQDKVEKFMEDGVLHIKNPEKPLRGEVILEIEKTLEINPYQFEEVGMRTFTFARDTDGEVILFNHNIVEAQRFNRDGEYMGNLVRKGQGPGEFTDMGGFSVCFMNNQIWATGNFKLAKYDKIGRFLNERKLGYLPQVFVDENTFFIRKMERNEEEWLEKVSLVNLSLDKDGESSIVGFFQEENLGMIQSKDRRSVFIDSWGTPHIYSVYNQENQKLYVGLNTEYKIYVKNLKGETMHVIERPYKNVKVNLDDKKELLSRELRNESSMWMLSVYPDTLVAIKDIKILPNGYLAVYRVSDVSTFEIDVFDPEGKYTYVIKKPEGISLDQAQFFSDGFATIGTTEDGFQIYLEYKIKNLPEVFRN